MMNKFSVLMSVYKEENPEYLSLAIESILHQTLLPNEVIIVEDGPLTEALDAMISQYVDQCPMIKRIPFKKNRGLGLSLRDGVLACQNEWIARMDTDDIAKPERFQKQIFFLQQHPDISLLGTGIEEFSIDKDQPDSITILPTNHKAIIEFAKRRNPFRHMTVIFKKEAVLTSGNYRHFLWFEDYDLWVRMLIHGFKSANLPEVLVSVRADSAMFARRGGWKYLKQDIKFQILLYKEHFIGPLVLLENIAMRGIVRLIPNSLRIKFYKSFLRNGRE